MRYTLDQTMYDKFRYHCFEWMDMQDELTDELQKVDNHGNLIHLSYLYQYGQRCQFNKEFHHICSKYLTNDEKLSEKIRTILLTSKHVPSLNALLSQHKPSYWIES